MKKIFSAILMILLGLVALIVAIVIMQTRGTAEFVVLLILGILVFFAGSVDVFFYMKRKGNREETNFDDIPDKAIPRYAKKPHMLSRPERVFYEQLKNIIDTRIYDIFPQIALVSVIDKLTLNSYRNELFRIADFCVVDNRTSEPLLLIELNDASHYKAERRLRDQKVKDLCDRAGIDIVAFSLEEAKDLQFVSRTIKTYL